MDFTDSYTTACQVIIVPEGSSVTLDNLGWTGPRYDDYTSVAYWYQTLPSAPLKPLPEDAELCMK